MRSHYLSAVTLLLLTSSHLIGAVARDDEDSSTDVVEIVTPSRTTQAPETSTTVKTSSLVTSTSTVNSTTSPLQTTTASTTTTTTQASKSKGKKSGKSSETPIKDCPEECSCVEKRIANCQGRKLKELPALRSFTFSDINLSNNNLEKLDFAQLPPTVETLDLSKNQIKNFVSSVRKPDSLQKLRTLNLSGNALESLDSFKDFKLPNLEVLDLSQNKINSLNGGLTNVKNLQCLGLRDSGLKSLDERDLSKLTELKVLNMTGLRFKLSPNQFSSNKFLENLDLSDCGLLDIPVALRDCSNLRKLTLNSNNMTSLRQSDFLGLSGLTYLEMRKCPRLTKVDEFAFSGMDNLKNLVLSDNPKLRSISNEAFKPQGQSRLQMIDLRNNNLSTLADPQLNLSWVTLKLDNNVWHCDCELSWIQGMWITRRPLMHCISPEQYRGLEVDSFFSMTDCERQESSYHAFILIGFLLFLFSLLVAVVVQKADVFRRFLWKDQYGTIYYTKASFPTTTETI